MKAVCFNEHGGPKALQITEDALVPEPGPGEVLIHQHAAGPNYVDTLVRGGYPGLEPPVPLSPGGDIAARVREFAPAGVDLLLDYVGTETFPTSFELLKKGGALLLCGIITGREAQISLHMTYLGHLSIHGLYLGTKAELATLVSWLADGRLKPSIPETMPLSAAAEGHRRLEAGEIVGK